MGKYKAPSVIYGEPKFKYPEHMNYGLFLFDKIVENKGKIAVINGETNEQTTYDEMAEQIVSLIASFERLGVKDNDVIGICTENRNEFLITAVAGFCTKTVVTFINNSYIKDELVHTLNITKPTYMFLSPTTYDKYYDTISKLNFVKQFFIFGERKPNATPFRDLVKERIDINSLKRYNFKGTEKTALVLYSSGTTGLPKGAKLSHRNLITAGLQPLSFKRGLVWLTIAPWTNTVGYINTIDAISYGQLIVYIPRFNEETYLRCIEKYKVGLIMAVPPLIVLLSKSQILDKYDVSSLEIMYCGGAPLDDSVIRTVKTRFSNLKHVLQGYGMTEATGAATEENTDEPRQGSVGQITQGNIAKIVDVETGKILGPNKPGEVRLKGLTLFQGYIGKDLSEDLDDEGYFKTGDIAYYDEDGYFYITGRIKELIKYKAWQVAPPELEAVIRLHPAVKDVGVIGTPDPLAGELPTAFVVKSPGAKVTEKEIIDHVAGKVSPWKQIRGGVRFVPEIPKNGSGKILRKILAQMASKPPMSKL